MMKAILPLFKFSVFTITLMLWVRPLAAEDRVAQLESKLAHLEEKVKGLYSGELPAAEPNINPQKALSGHDDVGQLREELKNIIGKLEEAQQDIKLIKAKVGLPSAPAKPAQNQGEVATSSSQLPPEEDVLSLLKESNSPENPEQKTPQKAAEAAAMAKAEQAAPKLSAGDEQAQYNQAQALFDRGEFKPAEAAFHAFIKTYPNSKLVGNALFWLGETHFARQEYGKAKISYVQAYKKATDKSNPNDSLAAQSLLKLGMSLAVDPGKRVDACTTFKKLEKDFPHMTKTIRMDLDEQLKTHCKDVLKKKTRP